MTSAPTGNCELKLPAATYISDARIVSKKKKDYDRVGLD